MSTESQQTVTANPGHTAGRFKFTICIAPETFPFFNPLQKGPFSKLVKLEAVDFIEAYRQKLKEWILISAESPSIKANAGAVLHYRARGVVRADGMPGSINTSLPSTPLRLFSHLTTGFET